MFVVEESLLEVVLGNGDRAYADDVESAMVACRAMRRDVPVLQGKRYERAVFFVDGAISAVVDERTYV